MPPKHIPIVLPTLQTGGLGDKPLPSLPSPTLTNPDFILPDRSTIGFPTPPRIPARPPSLSYLVDEAQTPSYNGSDNDALGTHSGGLELHGLGITTKMNAPYPRGHATSSPQGQECSALASSPLLPTRSSREKLWERYNEERNSSALSSVRSEELDNIPDVVGLDDEGSDVETLDGNDFAVRSPDKTPNDEEGTQAQDDDMRTVDLQEQSSATLSRRAELILANAKKKLLLMDQNLRGARDLVTPLTTANLRRATSVNGAGFDHSSRYDTNPYGPEDGSVVDSPSTRMSEGFARSHTFGGQAFNTDAPNRPRTALARTSLPQFSLNRRPTINGASPSWTPRELRSSRSQEGLRMSRVAPRPLLRAPPDAALAPLPEDEASPPLERPGLNDRSNSSTSDLRLQMRDLKGRISDLAERAREDSLRRRSMQNLRNPSPFTDAEYAVKRPASTDIERKVSSPSFRTPDPSQTRVGSDEEFSAFRFVADRVVAESPRLSGAFDHGAFTPHALTSDPAEDSNPRSPTPSTVAEDETEGDFVAQEASEDDAYPSTGNRTDEESIYEDAVYELPHVTPHEEREDAFDYQNFFLHSAMGSLSRSRSSSTSSVDSGLTARGPLIPTEERPPPTPETPEALRQIERNLHKRTMSYDSLTSTATFATADEGEGGGRRSGRHTPLTQSRSNLHSNSNDGSDRADSGVGFPERGTAAKRSMSRSPPLPSKPLPNIDSLPQPLASVALAALTDPKARPLDLKDRDLLFTLVESLRDVCARLQNQDDAQYERRLLRRRLDDARRALEGAPLA